MELKDVFPRYMEVRAELQRWQDLHDLLRAEVDRLAKQEWQVRSAKSWKASGIGDLRLDGTDSPPQVIIDDPAAFASYVAQQDPDLVVATITVPAGQLEDALDAMRFADVPVDKSQVVVPPGVSKAWVKGNTRPVADVTNEGDQQRWVVQQTRTLIVEGEEKTTVVTDRVPGLAAFKAGPTLKVILDPALKEQIGKGAAADLDEILAEGSEAPAPAEPHPTPADQAAALAVLDAVLGVGGAVLAEVDAAAGQ
jgi:hypothetical protein